jgi:GGDEF domain-containing protein
LAAEFGTKCLKSNERIARFSENEFLVLFDHKNTQRSNEFSQQLYKLIAEYPWENTNTNTFSVRVGNATINNNIQQSFSSLVTNAKLSLKHRRQQELYIGDMK